MIQYHTINEGIVSDKLQGREKKCLSIKSQQIVCSGTLLTTKKEQKSFTQETMLDCFKFEWVRFDWTKIVWVKFDSTSLSFD